MVKYLVPLKGFIIGLCLIIFREKVSQFLKNLFEKFPKYEDGVKSLNIKFDIRPGFITLLGIIFIIIAIACFINIIGQSP